MTALALSTMRPEISWLPDAPSARAARWLALFLVLAGMALPDCCLTGRHMFGAGMDGFGPICRAIR